MSADFFDIDLFKADALAVICDVTGAVALADEGPAMQDLEGADEALDDAVEKIRRMQLAIKQAAT